VQRLGEAGEGRDDPLLVGGEAPARRAGLGAGPGQPPAHRRGLAVHQRHAALGPLDVVGDHAVGGLVVVAVGLPVRRQHDPVLDRHRTDPQRRPEFALRSALVPAQGADPSHQTSLGVSGSRRTLPCGL